LSLLYKEVLDTFAIQMRFKETCFADFRKELNAAVRTTLYRYDCLCLRGFDISWGEAVVPRNFRLWSVVSVYLRIDGDQI